MNETQEKIYDLWESYLEYCKTNGYTERYLRRSKLCS